MTMSADQIAKLAAALKWYGEEAAAIERNFSGMTNADKSQAVMASLTVLALDGGRRAREALAESAKEGR